MAVPSISRYDHHGRRVYDDDVFDGIGRADAECRSPIEDEDDEDTESYRAAVEMVHDLLCWATAGHVSPVTTTVVPNDDGNRERR